MTKFATDGGDVTQLLTLVLLEQIDVDMLSDSFIPFLSSVSWCSAWDTLLLQSSSWNDIILTDEQNGFQKVSSCIDPTYTNSEEKNWI